jgi:hypothetical protein
MTDLRTILLQISDAYESELAVKKGRSLARIATIVLNRGSFFDSLRKGATCNLDSFRKIIEWFASPPNWPGGVVPDAVMARLALPIYGARLGDVADQAGADASLLSTVAYSLGEAA